MSKLQELQLCAALITVEASAALFCAADRTAQPEIVSQKGQVAARCMYSFALFRRFAELLTEFEYAGAGRAGCDVNTVKAEQRNEERVQIIVMAAEVKGAAFAADRTDCPGNLTGWYYFGI